MAKQAAFDTIVVRNIRHERLIVLINDTFSSSNYETSVLRDCSDTSDLFRVINIEGLNFSIIVDRPDFNNALGICRDKTVQSWQCVDSDKRLLVTTQFVEILFHVRVPNKNFEVKAATHYDLVLLTVGYISDWFLVTFEFFLGRLGKICLELRTYF